MGLFNVFKKLFHSSTDNPPAIEQTAAQDNPPLVKITFSQKPSADSPSPDIVPLNVLLKKAGECKIVCVNRYCMNLLYAPYWGKQR